MRMVNTFVKNLNKTPKITISLDLGMAASSYVKALTVYLEMNRPTKKLETQINPLTALIPTLLSSATSLNKIYTATQST